MTAVRSGAGIPGAVGAGGATTGAGSATVVAPPAPAPAGAGAAGASFGAVGVLLVKRPIRLKPAGCFALPHVTTRAAAAHRFIAPAVRPLSCVASAVRLWLISERG